MQEFSLLYPQGYEPDCQTLTEEACNDLSLELICDKLTEDTFEHNVIKNIMMKVERNPEVIRYRADIFDDIVHFPKLREHIKDLLEQLAFLKELERSLKDTAAAPIWQLVNRLNELDIYINCISGINEALSENDIKSEGLRLLKDYVNSIYLESGFEHLKEDIKDLVNEVREVKSVSLGVNLDNLMRPVEVGIVSINTEPFTKTPLLSRFLNFATKDNQLEQGASFHGMTRFHTVSKVAGEDPLTSNLTNVITEMLGLTVKRLKGKLSKYTNVSGYGLTKLIPEFLFYIRWADYINKMQELGITVCKPEISDNKNRDMHVKGLYNFKLAMQQMDKKKFDIVPNDMDFDADHRIYIMTGPNRGGKTTMTQAVGILFLLVQNGIYAPCESVCLSPVDNIYTHFPADENKTVDLGRLGEESKRMSEIFAQATNESLLLFNESLATTSFAEGLYIAKDVVRALRYLGARTIFNTHMHELAMNLNEVNTQIEGDSKVASLITGIHEGKRSYKIFLAPPEGVSYAQDIAKKYGVTFDQLAENIRHQ